MPKDNFGFKNNIIHSRENTMRNIEHYVMKKTYFKYLLFKIRNKISYIAFKKRYTISELFCKTILMSMGIL